MYKYGCNISDKQFEFLQKKFERWLDNCRECEREVDDEEQYETYDLLEDAYDCGYDEVEEVYNDTARTAFFQGVYFALELSKVMATE